MRRPRWRVGVVVPAHQEEARVAACVASIRAALASGPRLVTAWIVVVADACRDRTASVAARSLAGDGEVVEANLRSVGAARRLGTARVLSRLGPGRPEDAWLLATDADGRVGRRWVREHLARADEDALAVVGMVRVDALDPRLGPGASARLAACQRVRADGTHGHVYGANLGLRADAYAAVGGWAPLRTGEDHHIVARVRRRGLAVAAPAACPVTTSGRLDGRAPGGFAARLRALGSGP